MSDLLVLLEELHNDIRDLQKKVDDVEATISEFERRMGIEKEEV